LGDVENSATFKPFDDLFDKDDAVAVDAGGGDLDMDNIDITQQLRDQETNEPSIDDL
jgi:hypothetical protein